MKNNPIDKIRDLLAEPAARRKAVICAGVVAVLAIGGAGIAIASNRPEPIDSSPSAVEKTKTDGDKASGAESVAPADIAKICPTLTLDGQDVGAPADELTVTTGQGRVLVTQRARGDAAATVDSTARRSAALARSLDGCETGGKAVETVTWAAIDEGGNVEVAVTNSPSTAPSGGTTADVVNGSGGHVISDSVWNSDGVHDSGYEQNAGTVTDSAARPIPRRTTRRAARHRRRQAAPRRPGPPLRNPRRSGYPSRATGRPTTARSGYRTWCMCAMSATGSTMAERKSDRLTARLPRGRGAITMSTMAASAAP